MERVREIACLIFTVVPAVCTSIDTRSLSNMRMDFRTDNYSNPVLGYQNELYIREKYFDLLSRFAQSYRNSYMPLGSMRRSLRSLKTLTSIKREKEEYEDLQNLQYYGTEIPKKFTVKRLFLPKYFSLWNTDAKHNIKEVDKPDDNEILLQHEPVSATSEHLNLMHFVKKKSSSASSSLASSNVPEIANNLHPSASRDLYLETIPISNSSQSLNSAIHPGDEKYLAISKRPRRFPPSNGRFRPDVCNMDDLEIDITFHEMMDTEAGLLRLSCTGKIMVNKCEGACNSFVKPSVNNYDGFERQCSCCKDSASTSRTVTLSMCMLGPEEVHGYYISRTIVEPTACSCQECRN